MKSIALIALLSIGLPALTQTAPAAGTEALDGLETVHGMIANGRGSRVGPQ